jgi:hypothetical protein
MGPRSVSFILDFLFRLCWPYLEFYLLVVLSDITIGPNQGGSYPDSKPINFDNSLVEGWLYVNNMISLIIDTFESIY